MEVLIKWAYKKSENIQNCLLKWKFPMFLKCDIHKDSLFDYSMCSVPFFMHFLALKGYFSFSTYYKVKNRRCTVSVLVEERCSLSSMPFS